MMMVLVGLIFVVVGFNVYHSLRRSVHERMEEIAVLKAVGVPPQRIQGVFILQGLFIGLAGGVVGLVVGLALAVNVNGVFDVVQGVVNSVLGMARLLATPFLSLSGEDFAIFSPAYFYLSSVPSHVYPTRSVPGGVFRRPLLRRRGPGCVTGGLEVPPRGGAAL